MATTTRLTGAIIAVLAAGALSVAAGPYSDELGGLHFSTGAIFCGWISGVVEATRPVANSGGYAMNDQGVHTNMEEAVIDRPGTFNPSAATLHVYSLGNGGSIVLTFDDVIVDGPGPDFAVFENGFTDHTLWSDCSREGSTNSFCYSELAFVEVATTTSAWARFPTVCLNTQALYMHPLPESERFSSQDVTFLDGFAGKHSIEYGTPFDLAGLRDHPAVTNGSVNLNCIRYIRIVDVMGDGNTADSDGRPVYDPYFNFQTGYPDPAPASWTDGFDLRAVGVINAHGLRILQHAGGPAVSWFAMDGRRYQPQCADSPAGEWVNFGEIVDGDDGFKMTAGQDSGVSRVFRLVEVGGDGQ